MVEVFDARGVSFVAVTQQFNTTTSMGRLTLNVLLSFAQFEREVTGEGIRDKIAASKRKGIWMGGLVPLGYEVRERQLVIDEAEAATVRRIFTRYCEFGSVRLLKEELDRNGVRSKVRVSQDGVESGGQAFSRGALYTLLRNPIYVGEIRHKGVCHPGQHAPIVNRAMWDKVAKLLALSRLRCRGSRWGFHRSQLVYVRGEGALYPVPRAFEEEGCYRRDYSGQELQRLLEFRLFLGLIQYAPPKISGTEGRGSASAAFLRDQTNSLICEMTRRRAVSARCSKS
jgi:recombinase/resolvase-like protein